MTPPLSAPLAELLKEAEDYARNVICNEPEEGPVGAYETAAVPLVRQAFIDGWEAALREAAPGRQEHAWQPIEDAPYATPVLAWLYLPRNPIASAQVIAQRVYIEQDDADTYPEHERRTVGCWWANGRYYAHGHVTRWMALPADPAQSTLPEVP